MAAAAKTWLSKWRDGLCPRNSSMATTSTATVEASETLKARARAIRDELAQVVAVALAECVGREPTDPDARLAAGLLLATWAVAFVEAHRIFRETRETKEANATFLAIVDQGTNGVKAAMAGTPYA